MSEFMWGYLIGGISSPFVWEGLKWCYRKTKEALKNE